MGDGGRDLLAFLKYVCVSVRFSVTKGECSDISLKVSHLLCLHVWLLYIYTLTHIYVQICVKSTQQRIRQKLPLFPWNPQQVNSIFVRG